MKRTSSITLNYRLRTARTASDSRSLDAQPLDLGAHRRQQRRPAARIGPGGVALDFAEGFGRGACSEMGAGARRRPGDFRDGREVPFPDGRLEETRVAPRVFEQ